MCELCDRIAAMASGEFDRGAPLAATNPPLTDYFAEYRTESEADLEGVSEYGSWKVSVAKVGGGTVGNTYPAGEDWIIQAYENGELLATGKVASAVEMDHEQALGDFARYYFDYQG
jgi:hypothetical protein